jgi:hypothetical protein
MIALSKAMMAMQQGFKDVEDPSTIDPKEALAVFFGTLADSGVPEEWMEELKGKLEGKSMEEIGKVMEEIGREMMPDQGGDHHDGPDFDVSALQRVYQKVGEYFSDRDAESMDPKEVLDFMMNYLKDEEHINEEILMGIRDRLAGLSVKEMGQALQKMAEEFMEHMSGSDGPGFDVEALHRVYMKVSESFKDTDPEKMDPREVVAFMMDYLRKEENVPEEILKGIKERLEGL